MKKRCTWLVNNFIDRKLYAPFVIEKDIDYLYDLQDKYNLLLTKAEKAGADAKSISIIKTCTDKIINSLVFYYNGEISKSHNLIKEYVGEIINHPLAVNYISNSNAFPGIKGSEVQFFRARTSSKYYNFKAKDMLHLPKKLRGKTNNYRFSIPGTSSLYLCNTSYGCWLETGKPSEHDFYVSPVLVDNTLRIFNLVIMQRNLLYLNDLDIDTVHCWLKLIILMIATSYVIEEENRTFKSEYIISQITMLICKELGLDGIAYYSKRVDDEIFANCAINLALFAPYDKGDYSSLCEHIKIDAPFNFSLYKQLLPSLTTKQYDLRIRDTGLITNVGNYKHQYPYFETQYYEFDRFLFSSWTNKDEIEWGNALKE